jgi:Family of unknown function (DUF6292)
MNRRDLKLNENNLLEWHEDPWVNQLGPYVAQVMQALRANGQDVKNAFLDPYDPRDATILIANSTALVFDAVSGWRYGGYVSGHKGTRTQLADPTYVGGGLLLPASEVAYRYARGVSEPHIKYRSVDDLRDGFDEALIRLGDT